MYRLGKNVEGYLRKEQQDAEYMRQRQQYYDFTEYLEVLRREVANLLINDAPDTLLTAYDEAIEYEKSIRERPTTFLQDERTRLSQKYPKYPDFDLLQTRHFVPYEEALEPFPGEDAIVERYLDITKWLCILAAESESPFRIVSPEERAILVDVVRGFKDHKLKTAVEHAMRRYFRDEVAEYDDDEYRVIRLAVTSPANEYAVEIKKSREYAVYEIFWDDDQEYVTIYRSDPDFELREHTAS